MHSHKFTLWSDPRNAKLLKRVRGKDLTTNSVDIGFVMSTFYTCDFCKNQRSAIDCGFLITCDPDSYFQEDELLSCPICTHRKFARILCSPNSDTPFYTNFIEILAFCAYNTLHNYYIPIKSIGLYRDHDYNITRSECLSKTRYDPFYQIDRTLFQLLHENLEL